MTAFVALLRAVNVGGRKLEMARLRALTEGLGYASVQTHIASGNLVFGAHGAPSAIRLELESAIASEFRIEVPVILRTKTQWARYVADCPFKAETEQRPSTVYLVLSHKKPAPGANQVVEAKATGGEQVKVVGDALWIDYPAGMGRSKITPAILDKAFGGPATARNWNTVSALNALLAENGR